MRIALLGYGKMGKVIERIAKERGHSVTHKVSNKEELEAVTHADVAIDFSVPEAAFRNISHCLNHDIPVISGTTGWLKKYHEIVNLCTKKQGAFIYASNFSLGVNIFFEINRHLAVLMNEQPQYKVTMEEIHHTQKLDTPSGTAISLAEDIIENSDMLKWSIEKKGENIIPITARRIEGVPGTHQIDYTSEVDTISLTHTAHNRNGFALGAIIAAEWLKNKKGIYTMKDVLNIG